MVCMQAQDTCMCLIRQTVRCRFRASSVVVVARILRAGTDTRR